MIIESKRIILRTWQDEDINDLVEGLNNINVSKWMAGVPYPYTENDAKDFINQVQKQDTSLNISLAKVLKEEKPNVIFSKGGFVSLPVVIAGKLLKIPIVAHESDLYIGLANKLSKPSVTVMCTTFEKTANDQKKNAVYTGSPMRQNMQKSKEQAKKDLRIITDKPILVVTGGSLGAQRINQKIRNELYDLTKIYYVIHLTGKNNIDPKLENTKDYMQIDFTQDMGTILSCADIVVSRAGSNTIFELATLKKPMLLIPLPKGNSRGDQVDNAKYFNNMGYANFVTEDQLEDSSLTSYINQTYKDREILKDNLVKADIKPANSKLLKIILENSLK